MAVALSTAMSNITKWGSFILFGIISLGAQGLDQGTIVVKGTGNSVLSVTEEEGYSLDNTLRFVCDCYAGTFRYDPQATSTSLSHFDEALPEKYEFQKNFTEYHLVQVNYLNQSYKGRRLWSALPMNEDFVCLASDRSDFIAFQYNKQKKTWEELSCRA